MSLDTETKRYVCVFRLGEASLCVAIDQVQQVVEHLPVLPVPLAPPVIRGLINLRGTVVTALDGGLVFDLGENNERDTHLVVLAGGQPLSLLVDDVIEVTAFSMEMLSPPPPNLSPSARRLVRGVICQDENLIMFVDVDRVAERISSHSSSALSAA